MKNLRVLSRNPILYLKHTHFCVVSDSKKGFVSQFQGRPSQTVILIGRETVIEAYQRAVYIARLNILSVVVKVTKSKNWYTSFILFFSFIKFESTQHST